jgi:hypothetical protein
MRGALTAADYKDTRYVNNLCSRPPTSEGMRPDASGVGAVACGHSHG